MSVSFTDQEEHSLEEKGYDCDESELGKVYFPKEGIVRDEQVIIKREEYPWITCFEVEGIRICT